MDCITPDTKKKRLPGPLTAASHVPHAPSRELHKYLSLDSQSSPEISI